jgi:hypothetical protein
MSKSTEEKIRESLIEQLDAQNKHTTYCEDLVNTYMTHWRVKEQLEVDIETNGLRVTVTSGNGFETEKPNTSIGDLQKETSIMLQILDKLGLRDPVIQGDAADDYL